RKGIQEQMDVVTKYGDYLGVKTVADLKKLIANQRELGIAQQGMKIQLGTALMPVLASVVGLLVAFMRILSPLIRTGWLFKGALVAIVAAFAAYKVMMLAATIAENVFNVSLGVTQMLITGGVVLAIVALIAIGYTLYKHWGQLSALAGR